MGNGWGRQRLPAHGQVAHSGDHWESADELRAALSAWQHKYNNERPHQALGYLTPDEYRRSRLGMPELAHRAAA